MIKKTTILALAGLLAGTALPGIANATVTVLGWPGGSEEAALRAATDVYNETAREDDKVELIFFSRDGFFDKLQADLAAGSDAFDINLIATYSIGRYAPYMEPIDLGDDADLGVDELGLDAPDVLAGADEAEPDPVDIRLDGDVQQRDVALEIERDRVVDPTNVDALAVRQLPPDQDPRLDVLAIYPRYLQLDRAVGGGYAAARLYAAEEGPVGQDLGFQDEFLPVLELDGLGDVVRPDLVPGEIQQDLHPLWKMSLQDLDHVANVVQAAVRPVDTGDVHAGGVETLQAFGVQNLGADRADEAGFPELLVHGALEAGPVGQRGLRGTCWAAVKHSTRRRGPVLHLTSCCVHVWPLLGRPASVAVTSGRERL